MTKAPNTVEVTYESFRIPVQLADYRTIALTDEEREELENLWGEMTDNAKPEISGGSSSNGSSSVGSSSGSSSSGATSSEVEDFKGIGTIGKVPGAIF